MCEYIATDVALSLLEREILPGAALAFSFCISSGEAGLPMLFLSSTSEDTGVAVTFSPESNAKQKLALHDGTRIGGANINSDVGLITR